MDSFLKEAEVRPIERWHGILGQERAVRYDY